MELSILATDSKEKCISINQAKDQAAEQLHAAAAKQAFKLKRKAKKYSYSAIISHLTIVALILSMIAVGYQSPIRDSSGLNSSQTSLEEANPSVDQVASANLAAVAAESADILVTTNVTNLSRSLNAKSELAQNDDILLNKPQILEQSSGERGIRIYITKPGDSVSQVAKQFRVSGDTIRWANNLTSDALNPGITLKVPSINGVLYTVKSGDTVATLASKYRADPGRIVTFNDAELSGLKPGQQIVIPNGILPENERPGYRTYSGAVAPPNSSVSGNGRITVFGGNGYDYGYCTWYAFNRRAELGRPIGSNWGNAVTWSSYARSAGFVVNSTPKVGAVLQNGGGWGGYGHVAVVERVNPNGSITVSEMNFAGWNVISSRTISAPQVSSYTYIH